MKSKKIVCSVILLAFLTGLTGCFSSNPRDIEAFERVKEVDVTADDYILQPPDEIEIHCSKVPEIHMQRQRIRPDGKISFESLGELPAAGKTPKELTQILNEKVLMLYALMGDNPIDVRIVVYRSKVYYVLGQVHLPGPVSYTGRDTLFRALASAKPNPMAWLERIQVIRPSSNPNVKPKIFEMNFDKMAAHGDLSKNVLLQEGDIVYVPPTVMAAIALKMEEFLRPIGRAFSTINVVDPTRRYNN
jgi:polysaccharide export outer membrane protein